MNAMSEVKPFKHIPTKIDFLDEILGGGLVPGAFITLSGQWGIGKTTLLLQAIRGIASKQQKVAWISTVEKEEMLVALARRLYGSRLPYVLFTPDVEQGLDAASDMGAAVVVIDDLFAAESLDHNGNPIAIGSEKSIRHHLNQLRGYAKGHTRAVVATLTLEDGKGPGSSRRGEFDYFVDVALYLMPCQRQIPDPDSDGHTKLDPRMHRLSCTKNRFGKYLYDTQLKLGERGFSTGEKK